MYRVSRWIVSQHNGYSWDSRRRRIRLRFSIRQRGSTIMKLLHIDSSVLGTHSASRALSAEIVAKQVELHPDIHVTYRDLAADAALHLSSAHLAAWQGGAVEDSVLG